jgi:putative FmdB family regulatory protein
MPIFEYLCPSCQHRFESIVIGSATPSCPSCQHQSPEKLISGFAVGGSGAWPTPASSGDCGSCGDPRGPGACSM